MHRGNAFCSPYMCATSEQSSQVAQLSFGPVPKEKVHLGEDELRGDCLYTQKQTHT